MNAKLYFLGAMLAGMLVSCSKTDVETPGEVTLEVSEIRLPADNLEPLNAATAVFTASQPWRIETSGTKGEADWLHVSPTSGEAGTATLAVTAEANPSPYDRTAYIRILCGGTVQSIAVTQPGDGTLGAGETIYEVGPQADTLRLQLRSGATYRIDIPTGAEWVKSEYLSHGSKIDTLALILSANPTADDRTAAVQVTAAENGFQAEIAVLQRSGVLDLTFELDKIQLPTGRSGAESGTAWVDSLFVAGFDSEGHSLFAESLIPATDGSALRLKVLPPAELIRNSYPDARIYIVANSSGDLDRWPENETQWLNGKDTAVNRLFGAGEVLPPLSTRVTRELVAGENRIPVALSHITAIVTFKVKFDEGWDSIPAIEEMNISGFSNWGYLFPSHTDTAEPQTIGFNPAVTPNGTNEYRFYAYENSRLVLTVLAGGRYYQGIAPDILKRGYSYSFNMRICEDGSCRPASAGE